MVKPIFHPLSNGNSSECKHSLRLFTRGIDPYGTGGDMSPSNINERGTSMVMSPNILEVMSFRMSTRVTATVVCCILTQILCVVSRKKLQLLGDFVPHSSYRGSAPGPCWGRPPAGAPLLGSPDPQSYFMSLPIIL